MPAKSYHKVSRKKSSVKHTRSKSVGGARSKSKSRSKSVPIRKSVVKKRSTPKPMANFYCMRCKKTSRGQVDRYEKGQNGGTFAKGRCNKCDTKMSLIVKNPN